MTNISSRDNPLLRQARQALLDGRQAALDRAGIRVVERDAPARGRDHLGDPTTHLAGADDENVLELHGCEAIGSPPSATAWLAPRTGVRPQKTGSDPGCW